MATSEMGKPLVESRAEVEKCAWACEWFADHGPAMLETESVETGARALLRRVRTARRRVRDHAVELSLLAGRASARPSGRRRQRRRPQARTVNDRMRAPARGRRRRRRSAGWGAVGDRRQPGADGGGERAGHHRRSGRRRDPHRLDRRRTVGRRGRRTGPEEDGARARRQRPVHRARRRRHRGRGRVGGPQQVPERGPVVHRRQADHRSRSRSPTISPSGSSPMSSSYRSAIRPIPASPSARWPAPICATRSPARSASRCDQGARVLAGGRAPDRPGFYYEPTVLDRVSPRMPVLTEEVFGPAVPLVRVGDADAAIRLANDTRLRVGEQRLDS